MKEREIKVVKNTSNEACLISEVFKYLDLRQIYFVLEIITSKKRCDVHLVYVKRIKKANKSERWMPRLWEAMKDVISCDKLGGGANNL